MSDTRTRPRPPLPPRPPERTSEAPPQTAGEILRAARLKRKISLTEAEQATRIRQRYLQALEDDDYGALPAGVYSVGFLRNYAIFLGVPPEDVLTGVDQRRRRDRRVAVQSVAPPIRLSAPRSTWFMLAGGVVTVLLLALAWLGLSDPNAEPAGSPAATSAIPAASPTTLASLPPLAPAATPTAAPTVQAAPTSAATAAAASRLVQVELRTVDRAWIRATVDGRIVLEETLPAGETRRWEGQQTVALRVGNGGGVDVTVNGQRIGALGPTGEPVDREFAR